MFVKLGCSSLDTPGRPLYYDVLPNGYIRLLRPLARRRGSELRFSLLYCHLKDASEYAAFSHCWRSDRQSIQITVNRQQLPISWSLWHALRDLSQHFVRVPVPTQELDDYRQHLALLSMRICHRSRSHHTKRLQLHLAWPLRGWPEIPQYALASVIFYHKVHQSVVKYVCLIPRLPTSLPRKHFSTPGNLATP